MSDSTLDDQFTRLNLEENDAIQEPSPASSSTASDNDADSASESSTDLEDETIHLVDKPIRQTSVKIMHGTFLDYRDEINEENLIRAHYYNYQSWDSAYDGPVLIEGNVAVIWTQVFRGNRNRSPFPSTIKIRSRPPIFNQKSYPHFIVHLDALDLDISQWALFRVTELVGGTEINLSNGNTWPVRNDEASLLLIRRNNANYAALSNTHVVLDINQNNGYLWHNGKDWVLNNRWVWNRNHPTAYLKLAIAGDISLGNGNAGIWTNLVHAILANQ
ncbi:hypothetical protein HK100_007918 [Physocladia obscura]|uniref:Uncharacterized protein n=1 Tax=Physocladia obscura TaxID=109957 RepID=A0AAD5X810_9FUNG|nr:hypothetical protein HK100_007918 [Physocladia obscura]